jgi:tetratricopeptide (TPR) repeat protein
LPKNPDISDEGLDRLRAAVRANPRSTAFVALAHRLCDASLPAEAEDVCREGLTQHPGLVTAQVALGRALLDRGRLREAQEVLIAAAKANPDHGDAFRWLGETVIKRGDLPRARTLLEYAEEISPSDKRVAELLVEAGGAPAFRAPRPKSDFEHTRVANARALADRMHEDPDELEPSYLESSLETVAGRSKLRSAEGFDEPTVVDGDKVLHALATSTARGAPTADSSPLPGATDYPAQPDHWGEPPRTDSRPVPPVRDIGSAPERRTLVASVRTPDPGRGRARTAALVVGALLVAGGLGIYFADRPRGPAEELRDQMRKSLAGGSLRSLLDAREQARQIIAKVPGDLDGKAGLAFVDALLARDYGLPFRHEAEELTADLPTGRNSPTARVALVHTTASLLALGAGDLAEAQRMAERAMAASPDATPPLLAAARVHAARGDLEEARRELERLLARAPDFAVAVIDWATILIDAGDAATAAQSLRAELEHNRDQTRARLLLAEARRALGERAADDKLAEACRDEAKQSPTIRAGCALNEAAETRLGGDRQAAVRVARAAAAEAPEDPRLLASAALLLATLGEVDPAAETLDRARKLARPEAPPLAWADLAVRLGRRQSVEPRLALSDASGPERRLVAGRMALVHGGATELGAWLDRVPGAALQFDPDLAALALLARPGNAARSEVQKRAGAGDPMAAYVIGRLSSEAGETREARAMLEKALWGHGDACEAATLYRALPHAEGAASPRALRDLRAHNAQCPPAQQ